MCNLVCTVKLSVVLIISLSQSGDTKGPSSLLVCLWSEFFSALYQMRQQAAAGGQLRPSLPNGPLAESSHHHAGLSRTSPLNHTAIRPPCVTQPTANGSCSSSPSAGLPGHPEKNHTLGLGGGGSSNGNVPYPQQNSLPQTCTAASHPSTSSTTSSPSHADETWRSQQRNTTTQVFHWILSSFQTLYYSCRSASALFVINLSYIKMRVPFSLSRGFKKIQVHIRQVLMENPHSLPLPPPLRPPSPPLAF